MKKMLLVLAAMMITAGAYAQMDWGFKGGLNLATVTDLDGKMKPSFYVGAFLELPLNSFVGLQPELVYSRQGSYDKAGDVKAWLRINNLNIPVMFKFYVYGDLSLEAGPQFGFNLNSKAKVKTGSTTVTTDVDGIKSFDFAIPIGASYKITDHIDGSIRYNIGVTKVMDGDHSARNGVLQIGAGYRF